MLDTVLPAPIPVLEVTRVEPFDWRLEARATTASTPVATQYVY